MINGRDEIIIMGMCYDRREFLHELNNLISSPIKGKTDVEIVKTFYNLPYNKIDKLLTALRK